MQNIKSLFISSILKSKHKTKSNLALFREAIKSRKFTNNEIKKAFGQLLKNGDYDASKRREILIKLYRKYGKNVM